MEILASLNCLFSLGLAAVFTIVMISARSSVAKLRARVQTLEQLVDAPAAPSTATAPVTQSPAAQPSVAAPTSEPLPTPARPARELAPASSGRAPERAPTTEKVAKLVQTKPVRTEAARKPNPLLAWFTGMHVMVQIGIVVLFFGVGFLVRYVAEQGWFPLEARLLSAAGLGVALAGVGWAVRRRRRDFALALQGGGIGIIYLTTFGAFRLYGLVPAPLAFGVFVTLGAALATLAVLNNARILAFLAILGAFLAPVLAPSDGGSHIALFSYFAVINAAILAIAWFKAWRSLNLVGFFFTLALSTWWGLWRYEPAMFASVEAFLWLFFGFYLIIAVLYARRRAAEDNPARAVDLTLIFGNAISFLALQYLLTEPRADWSLLGRVVDPLAVMSLIVGVIYLGVFALLRKSMARLAGECFLFLGTLCLALAVPLAAEARITAAFWAVQGGLYIWLGAHRKSGWLRSWGALVQLGAAAFFTEALLDGTLSEVPVLRNDVFIGGALLALAALGSAFVWQRQRNQRGGAVTRADGLLVNLWTLWGLLWWFATGLWQLLVAPIDNALVAAVITFFALSGALGEWLGRRERWIALCLPLQTLLPLLPLLAFWQIFYVEQPLAAGGWYAWPLAISAHFWMLRRRDRSLAVPTAAQSQQTALQHAGILWAVAGLLVWESVWLAQRVAGGWTHLLADGSGWLYVALLLVPVLLLATLSLAGGRLGWPLSIHRKSYQRVGAGGLIAWLLAVATVANFVSPGTPLSSGYLPVFNPLDLAQIATFVVLALWLARVVPSGGKRRLLGWSIFVAGFVAFNALLARAAHHVGDVPFTMNGLLDSAPLQTSYAICWSTLALGLMVWASRRAASLGRARMLWSTGGTLLGATVLKLFIVDLSGADTVARIVSFIGVGLLMIAIAYFAPAPRREALTEHEVNPAEQVEQPEQIAPH